MQTEYEQLKSYVIQNSKFIRLLILLIKENCEMSWIASEYGGDSFYEPFRSKEFTEEDKKIIFPIMKKLAEEDKDFNDLVNDMKKVWREFAAKYSTINEEQNDDK